MLTVKKKQDDVTYPRFEITMKYHYNGNIFEFSFKPYKTILKFPQWFSNSEFKIMMKNQCDGDIFEHSFSFKTWISNISPSQRFFFAILNPFNYVILSPAIILRKHFTAIYATEDFTTFAWTPTITQSVAFALCVTRPHRLPLDFPYLCAMHCDLRLAYEMLLSSHGHNTET